MCVVALGRLENNPHENFVGIWCQPLNFRDYTGTESEKNYHTSVGSHTSMVMPVRYGDFAHMGTDIYMGSDDIMCYHGITNNLTAITIAKFLFSVFVRR